IAGKGLCGVSSKPSGTQESVLRWLSWGNRSIEQSKLSISESENLPVLFASGRRWILPVLDKQARKTFTGKKSCRCRNDLLEPSPVEFVWELFLICDRTGSISNFQPTQCFREARIRTCSDAFVVQNNGEALARDGIGPKRPLDIF